MAELEQGLEELKVVKQAFKDNFDNEDVSTNNVEFRNMPNLLKQMEKKLPLQTKSVEPNRNIQTVRADSGFKLEGVEVKAIPSQYIIPTGTKEITENNEYDVTEYSKVKVQVANAGTGTGGNPKFSQLIDGSIESLEEIDLSEPNTVRDYAFYGCTNLTSAVIPSNVNTIGANSFQNCTNLQTLILADGVTTIGANAFNNTAISVLDIPASVISIGDGAFAGTNITEIDMSKHPIPPSITNTSLPSSLTTIKVAYRNYDTYLSEWSYYANKIVRLPAIPSTIRVVVNNYLGELVSNAVVAIEGNGQVYTGLTDSVGVFEQGDLQPATYTITIAEIDGFKTPEPQEVVVAENTQNNVVFTYLEKPAILPFAESSADQIATISAEISAQNMTSAQVAAKYGWNVGDIKPIPLSSGEVIEMQIAGYNHYDLRDGSGKAGILLQMVNCLNTTYGLFNTGQSITSWYKSTMRNKTLPTYFNLLPVEWQNVIKTVSVYYVTTAGSGGFVADTSGQLFLPAEIEIFGTSTKANQGSEEGTQYEYWANHNTATDRIKYINNNGALESYYWWLRSAASGSSTNNFCEVTNSGTISTSKASAARGISFVFCV